jgi:hypothetical protein
MSKIPRSLVSYFRAPMQLLKGNTDGATVNKAIFTILAGGVSLSLLALVAIKVWAQAPEEADAPEDFVGAAAFVNTDKLDYEPGETAYITGGGFEPGETVELIVLHANETPNDGHGHGYWHVVADENGEFETTWSVCEDDCLGSLLHVIAMGLSSGFEAEAFFADDVTSTPTDPAPQAVPYCQEFSALPHTGTGATNYPAGWRGWNLRTGGSTTSFLTDDPNISTTTADLSLGSGNSASTTAGGIHNYNRRIGFLASGTVNPSLVLALNTTGKAGLRLNFEIGVVRNPFDGGSNTRINAVDVQYRIGTSGAFTSLSGGAGVYTSSAITPAKTGTGDTAMQDTQTITINLPAELEDQPIVQIRWVQRDVSGGGGRPSFAIDNVSVEANAVLSDNACKSPYGTGNYHGQNGGTGFNPWIITLSNPGNLDQNGAFIGRSDDNGGTRLIDSFSCSLSGRSWALYANSGQEAQALRTFANGGMGVGQVFQVDFDNGANVDGVYAANRVYEVQLLNSNGLMRWGFHWRLGAGEYQIFDDSGGGQNFERGTGIAFTSSGLRIRFTVTGPNTYMAEIIRLPATTTIFTFTGTLRQGPGRTDTAIDRVLFINRDAGSGSSRNFYFNNLSLSSGCGPACSITQTMGNDCAGTQNSFAGPTGSVGATKTYAWTLSDNTSGASIAGSANSQTVTVNNGSAAGSYTLNLTFTEGGFSSTCRTTIFVNATPAAPSPSNNGPLCEGETLNLFANTTADGYTWVGPNGFTSSAQNPSIPNATTAASGSYSLFVTSGGCASAAGSTTAIVNPGLDCAVSPFSATICAGNTQTFTANPVGGTGPYTFSWSGPEQNGATSQSITVSTAGTYTVTITDAAGCSTECSATLNVTVAPTTAASSNSPICEGDTLNLFATGNAIDSYSWTGPNGFTSTQQNPSIPNATAAASGTYTVTRTVAGCPPASDSVTVTIHPAPDDCLISGEDAVCSNSAGNIYSGPTGMASYSWSIRGDGSISGPANAQTVTVHAGASGSYTLTLTIVDSNGCTSTCEMAVQIDSTPPFISEHPEDQATCLGGDVNFTAAASDNSPVNFVWRKRGSGWGGGGWQRIAGGGGFFVASSTDNNSGDPSSTPDGDINTSGKAWGLFNTALPTTEAIRPFNGTLEVGQQFRIDMDNGNVLSGGPSVGFNLRSGSTTRFTLVFRGGDTQYRIVDASGINVPTGIGFTRSGLRIVFTLTGPDTYSVTITRLINNVSSTITGTLAGTPGAQIDNLRLFHAGQQGGLANNLYFNNISFGCKDDNAAAYTTATWTTGSDFGNAPLANGDNISGADTDMLTISDVESSDGGQYDVCVTDACGLVTVSTPATLTANAFQSVATVFTETMGNVTTTTLISTHEAASGFDNDGLTMSGSGDLRSTSPSTGYAGASGGANVFLTNIAGRNFQIEGVAVSGPATINVSFGVFKSTTGSTGADLIVEVSTDGVTYTPLSFPALPSGSGTAAWHFRTATGTIASGTSNLRVRFRQAGTATQYRIDDVTLMAVSTTALVTAINPTTFCPGGFVTLHAGSGSEFLWSTGETTQSINISASGSFSVTITDANGCLSTSSPITVVVEDNLAPVPNVATLPTVTGQCSATITTAPTATDNCAGTVVGTTNDPLTYSSQGTFVVTWTYDDGNGNTTTQTQTVIVDDVTAPVITVQGNDPETVECGSGYVDAGATAFDNCAGAVAVSTSGSVDTSTPGTYTITYTADDGNGNMAIATRIVNVVDTTGPVITVLGSNPETVQCGDTYTDAGATAFDTCAGSLAVDVSGSVDTSTPGTYTITYTADDGNGNIATTTRVVNVADTVAPEITVLGNNPETIECGSGYLDAGATASDACAGSVTVVASGVVDASTPGSYTITYTADDGNGNVSTATRTVIVVDTSAPVITVLGNNPETVECGTTYTDAGATASDACAGTLAVNASGSVDTSTSGTYTITYTASDPSGNTATVTRTVNVVDSTSPNLIVPADATVECGHDTSPTATGQATATDTCDSAPVLAFSDSSEAGCGNTETIMRTWKATDASGNTATSVQTISVVDTTAPSITCPADVTVESEADAPLAATTVAELQAQGGNASDTCGAVTISHSDSVESSACGKVITRTYKATDECGNTATCTQTITVAKFFATDGIIWLAPIARAPANADTNPSLYTDNGAGTAAAPGGILVARTFKGGSTLPVKIDAIGCTGNANVVNDPTVSATVELWGDTNADGIEDDSMPIDFNGVGAIGGVMDKINGHFQFNLDTKKLPAGGTNRFILKVTIKRTTELGTTIYTERVLLMRK